jgi:hypothetical protein
MSMRVSWNSAWVLHWSECKSNRIAASNRHLKTPVKRLLWLMVKGIMGNVPT